MKKSIYVFGMAASLLLASCGAEAESETKDGEGDNTEATQGEEDEAEAPSILGSWQMTDMDLGMDLTPEQQAEMDEAIKEMAAASVYTFSDDGTMSFTSPQGDETATYTLSGTELNTTSDSGKEEKMQVSELTETSLVLTMDMDGSEAKMSFTRK